VYATAQRGWRCYGRCARGGTIYDLAALVWGLDISRPQHRDYLEVKRRLTELFSGEQLDIDGRSPSLPAQGDDG
jgi:hypothetical protein